MTSTEELEQLASALKESGLELFLAEIRRPTHIPGQLGILGGLLVTAAVGELIVRRGRSRPLG